MEQTLLLVLYGALILLVVVVGGLLAVVLWQLSLAIAQARTTLLPQVQQILHDVERSMLEVEHITGDVYHKLQKLDEAVEATNEAVGSVAKTTTMVNTRLAQPLLTRMAVLGAGIRGAMAVIRQRREQSAQARAQIEQRRELVAEKQG